MVIVDTAIWIDYLRRKRSPTGDPMADLIDSGNAALAGVVLAELLRGARNAPERARLEYQLEGATFMEMSMEAWRRAGIIGSELDSSGLRIPMSDVIIAALALEGAHEIFTRDRHFERIPGLHLYQPEGDA